MGTRMVTLAHLGFLVKVMTLFHKSLFSSLVLKGAQATSGSGLQVQPGETTQGLHWAC